MSTLYTEINCLKKEKNAVILAHYYVPEEVQKCADHIGDSFYLSKVATTTDADIIVFCGVSFMGESAKILNPEKAVLMPDAEADCPMAHMADIAKIEELRAAIPDLAVVCYINSTAELKTYADVCVTSSNAIKIVSKLPQSHILFLPDANLGRYVAAQLPEKTFHFQNGFCPVHNVLSAADVRAARHAHPDAALLVHPECTGEVVALADFAGSTSEIIDYAAASSSKDFLIGTEAGVFFELKRRCPGKQFYPVREAQCCTDMKRVTLEKVRDSLSYGTYEVRMDETQRRRAALPLQRMLELGR